MKAHESRGFTIIETVLFLGVTGLLVFAILGGTGAALNQQRYRDSVNSFASFLQSQFDDTMVVSNERHNNWTCSTADGAKLLESGVGVSRGTTDCIVLGRFVYSTDGKSISTDTVIAHNVSSVNSGLPASDTAVLKSLKLQTLGSFDESQREIYEPEWGTRLRSPVSGNPLSKFSILIVRSPTSGAVRTYVSSATTITNPNDLVDDAYASKGITFCIDPDGLTFVKPIAVELMAGSASANGVRINGTEEAC